MEEKEYTSAYEDFFLHQDKENVQPSQLIKSLFLNMEHEWLYVLDSFCHTDYVE